MPLSRENFRQAAVGGAAGAVAGWLIVLAAQINARGASILVNSDVIGAALGAALTIAGALGIDRIITARRQRDAHAQLYTVGAALLGSMDSLAHLDTRQMRTCYDRAVREKKAFDVLRELNPPHEAAPIVTLIDFLHAWDSDFDNVSWVMPDGIFAPAPEGGNLRIEEATREIRRTLTAFLETVD